MLKEVSSRAYAKVNFGLRVLPKGLGSFHNSDGFHNIESIFQTIDLCDELRVTPISERACIVHCDSMQLPENNTLSLAYNAFCECTGRDSIGLEVNLIKGIPAGGGLGGGSSDAAALIRILQRFYDIELNDKQLDYIASKTGSDVFFFMHCDKEGRGCALVSGRGEFVKKIENPRDDLYLVMIFPESKSSTKEAYALIDQAFSEGKEIKSPELNELEDIYRMDPGKWTFINTFTPVIASANEEIGRAIEALKNVGCCYTEMSGSGSTVFGAFTDRQQAISASNLLGETWNCKLVQTV
ncbi:MAG: 4-(cytidine 5'-diphospho)-2-C-methyl-D-erythritol kinase [Treponema sp.]|nr:4-(cytidine 5'-diphospho)-2-C-methyl-D-erythritol kinase [Treponema sp.]